MIHEFSPITNSFVSVPSDMGHFNCASFLAGIIAGVLDSAKFVSSTLRCIGLTLPGISFV
jgi:trafficking protein particle complex subunit 5